MRKRGELRGESIMQRLKVFVGGILVGCILCSHTTALAHDQGNHQDPIVEDYGIPEEIKSYCDEIGAEFDICPELLEAIAWHESRFIPDVKNKNCFGLCQVNIKIHSDRLDKYGYTQEDMLTAYANIQIAADYLFELFSTYGDDDAIIMLLYSGAGSKAIEKYKEFCIIPEYVDEILTLSAFYERIHGK